MENRGYLGVMLDCSRNAVMSVKGLKSFILKLKAMGYNCLQLYTEDTYEIEGEPLFGYRRGRYTRAELTEIDAFAAENGIELMPCIQTLAHLNAIFRYQRYTEINDVDDILLADDERTYAFIEKMIKSCAESFTSRNIHIGMDEAHLVGRGRYLDINGSADRHELLLRHLKRVIELCEKYGFKPMMWNDMFFRIGNGGRYYGGKVSEAVKKSVPENIRLVYWDYYNENAEIIDGMMRSSLEFKRPVWVAGGANNWYGFHSDNERALRQTEALIKGAERNGINNILITMWGDDGNECCPYAVLPSLLYAAECARGNYGIENAKRRFHQLFSESFDDFMLCDLKFSDTDGFKGYSRGVKEMLYNDCFLPTLDCAVLGNGAEDREYARLAERLSEAAERSQGYSYMFRSYASLCRVLSVKYSLGFFTGEAYRKNDRSALLALLPKYEELIRLLEEFHSDFEKMWLTDNKPHGFDIQDIRLGGVIQRTKSCMLRLKAYLDGETDCIEELSEESVDFFTGGAPERRGVKTLDNYATLVSPNVLCFRYFK